MLVENATSPLGKDFPQALVLWTVCTSACGKPFPKIVPMAKLDILLFFFYIVPFNNGSADLNMHYLGLQ